MNEYETTLFSCLCHQHRLHSMELNARHVPEWRMGGAKYMYFTGQGSVAVHEVNALRTILNSFCLLRRCIVYFKSGSLGFISTKCAMQLNSSFV